MFIPDLSPYQYGLPAPLPNVRCVGWLEKGHPFGTGPSSERVLCNLKYLIVHRRVEVSRGLHYCDFCTAEEIPVELDGISDWLGHAEVWVPHPDGKTVFAAPTLLLHYMTGHAYLPPREFIDAVEHFNPGSTWNGEEYRELLVNQLLKKHRES